MPQSSKQPSDLERSIFRTVAWFSLSDYPVTGFEIWKWLLRPIVSYRLSEVRTVLQESAWLAERIEHAGGFFVLKGGRGFVQIRHDRYLDAARKYKRLSFALKYLARIPTMKTIAACNTLAWSNTTEASDIDLFIVTSSHRIWVTRLLAAFPFVLMRMRPGSHKRDPFCFSFFVTEHAQDLSCVRLHPDDVYLAQWVRSLVPVFDHGIFEDFQIQNRWVHRLFPNAFATRVARPRRTGQTHAWFAPLGLFESVARFLQRRHLPERLRAQANKDTRVVVHDNMLKFHDNDRREEFLARWRALCLNDAC